jgi:hypothetical protein
VFTPLGSWQWATGYRTSEEAVAEATKDARARYGGQEASVYIKDDAVVVPNEELSTLRQMLGASSQERCAPERETYDAPELETYELIQFVPASLRYGSIIWPDIDPSNLPENVCSRLLSLLQTRRIQTFSAATWPARNASFRAVLRIRLGVSTPERSGNSLSGRRSLSGAWESTDLLYKLFHQRFQ